MRDLTAVGLHHFQEVAFVLNNVDGLGYRPIQGEAELVNRAVESRSLPNIDQY